MTKANKRNPSIFETFFDRFLKDPEQGRRSVTTGLNFSMYSVTNSQFYSELGTMLESCFPDEIPPLGEFNGLAAEFGFISTFHSAYLPKNDFSHEKSTNGILIVRIKDKMFTFIMSADEHAGIRYVVLEAANREFICFGNEHKIYINVDEDSEHDTLIRVCSLIKDVYKTVCVV